MENSKPPFFSVVIPSYNRSGLILKAIESVMNQSFKDFELIVADDCSTDDSEKVIQSLNNSKISFFKNDVNKGNAGARNLGARNANGTYVCYLDSDDQYHPHFLQKMFSLIQDGNNPGFLWCNVNRIDADGNNLNHSIPSNWDPLRKKDPYLFFLNGLNFGTDFGFTVRRDCFDKTGFFDENLRAAVDTDFILRIVQDFNFNFTREILVDTYDHDGERVRKNSLQKLKSYQIIIEKHRSIIEKHQHLIQRWNYKLMWLNYHNSKKIEGRKYLKNAMSAGKYKAILAAMIFELFPADNAIYIHKYISKSL